MTPTPFSAKSNERERERETSATRSAVLFAGGERRDVVLPVSRVDGVAGSRGSAPFMVATSTAAAAAACTRCAHEGCEKDRRSLPLSLSLSPVASASNLGSARPRANTNASSLARVRPSRLIAPAGRGIRAEGGHSGRRGRVDQHAFSIAFSTVESRRGASRFSTRPREGRS